jgi:multicomponent Na+:H+ antiporter subunit F
MFTVATLGMIVALSIAVIRAIRGPTVFDRVLAANVVGTLAILLLASLGFLLGRPEWLDIGLTYAFLNLIATLAVLKYFRHGDLAHDPREDQ